MTPRAPSRERVFNIHELKAWLNEFMPLKGGVLEEVIALIAMVDEVKSLEAENERLKEDVGRLGVQNEMLKGPWSKIKIVGGAGSWKDKYFNASDLCQFLREDNDRKKAQLAKQAPLIEAVMGADNKKLLDEADILRDFGGEEDLSVSLILRAALKFRKE